MDTIATLFSGGEGVGIGAQAAGLRHIYGVEVDDAVAQVARDNGFDVETADILEVDPADYETPTVLHASPPCPNFSVAKQGRRETDYDLALAKATARFVEVLRPQFFTLENVYGYRKSESWRIIADTLNRCGYWYDLAHVNAADFGVPQTRKRMIVRAALGQMVPHLPPPEPWVGWYAAIEDLLPTLPESQFAPWQLARLELGDTVLVNTREMHDHRENNPLTARGRKQPAMTVTATSTGSRYKALLVDSAGYPSEDGVRIPVTRHADEPVNTVIANHAKRGMRAFLVGGQFARPADGSGELRPVQVRESGEPTFTITAQNKGDWRAWLSRGRVVQMTPRALARFQTFPDWYRFSGKKVLDCRVVGEAVPPLLYEKLIKHLLNP